MAAGRVLVYKKKVFMYSMIPAAAAAAAALELGDELIIF